MRDSFIGAGRDPCRPGLPAHHSHPRSAPSVPDPEIAASRGNLTPVMTETPTSVPEDPHSTRCHRQRVSPVHADACPVSSGQPGRPRPGRSAGAGRLVRRRRSPRRRPWPAAGPAARSPPRRPPDQADRAGRSHHGRTPHDEPQPRRHADPRVGDDGRRLPRRAAMAISPPPESSSSPGPAPPGSWRRHAPAAPSAPTQFLSSTGGFTNFSPPAPERRRSLHQKVPMPSPATRSPSRAYRLGWTSRQMVDAGTDPPEEHGRELPGQPDVHLPSDPRTTPRCPDPVGHLLELGYSSPGVCAGGPRTDLLRSGPVRDCPPTGPVNLRVCRMVSSSDRPARSVRRRRPR